MSVKNLSLEFRFKLLDENGFYGKFGAPKLDPDRIELKEFCWDESIHNFGYFGA